MRIINLRLCHTVSCVHWQYSAWSESLQPHYINFMVFVVILTDRDVLSKRPESIRDFAADWFTQPELPTRIQADLEKREKALRDDKFQQKLWNRCGCKWGLHLGDKNMRHWFLYCSCHLKFCIKTKRRKGKCHRTNFKGSLLSGN